MTKKQILKILVFFTIVVALLTVGIAATLILQSSSNDQEDGDNYDIAFGNLPSPIIINYDNSISIVDEINNEKLVVSNSIYKIDHENTFFPSKDLSRKVGTILNFTVLQEEENFLIIFHKETGESITYNDDTASMLISFNMEEPNIPEELFDDNKARLVATAKLEELELWPYKDDPLINYKYYDTTGYNYYETLSRENASLVAVIFSHEIDNIPLLSSNLKTGEIEVLINRSEQIVKIDYAFRPVKSDEKASYPINNETYAISQVQTGYAELIIPFEGIIPTTIKLRDLTFAYRLKATDQEYLLPVYIFEGRDNNQQDVSLIVPAINEQYLIEEIPQ